MFCWTEDTLDNYLPKQLTQHSGGELRVLPAAEAQQLYCLLRVAAILDDFLHIAGPYKQDLSHQLLHRHHWGCQVGVTIWVRERRVTWTGKRRLKFQDFNCNFSRQCLYSSSLKALSPKLCLHNRRLEWLFRQSPDPEQGWKSSLGSNYPPHNRPIIIGTDQLSSYHICMAEV